jgi:hypothetical protein
MNTDRNFLDGLKIGDRVIVRRYGFGECMPKTPLLLLSRHTSRCRLCWKSFTLPVSVFARLKLVEKTGMRTVLQIFVGETLVGGFTDLDALERAGKLAGSSLERATSEKSTPWKPKKKLNPQR